MLLYFGFALLALAALLLFLALSDNPVAEEEPATSTILQEEEAELEGGDEGILD